MLNKIPALALCVLLTQSALLAHAQEIGNSFQEQTQTYRESRPSSELRKTRTSSEIAWSQGEGKWHVIRHLASTDKEYYSATSSNDSDYMSLSVLFTPKKNCNDGKVFIAAKLSSPTPFSAKKLGSVTTQFDDFESRSFDTDYIFTRDSHTIWIDMPDEFRTGARRFNQLTVQTHDYLKGAPARTIELSGSIAALKKAQALCQRRLK